MAMLKLIPIGQAFASEKDALDAVEKLKASEFEESEISIITPAMIESANPAMLTKGETDGVDSTEMLAQVIMSVHEASDVPGGHAMVYADAVQQGRSVVLITAPFGEALRATETLKTGKQVDIGPMPEMEYHTWQQPAPLSALLGMPVLAHRRSWMSRAFGELTESGYFPTKGLFGGLLSDNPTPLSSKIGFDVLKDNNPAPLSSKLGLRTIKDDPTPISDLTGLKPLSNERSANKSSSFGLPLLSKNPTPLSSMFGLRVLSHDD
ncbi:MAG: hypothetical protein KTR32_00155 [Granulosicoccus sp.]|nr:hypothetical protein [Granulosicoccus sp.]